MITVHQKVQQQVNPELSMEDRSCDGRYDERSQMATAPLNIREAE
jgi:hypothetical protein